MAAVVVTNITQIKILRHLLIRDEMRYARDMQITPETARFCAQLTTEVIKKIQDGMAGCGTGKLRPANIFGYLAVVGNVFRLNMMADPYPDAYLLRLVEDLYRRARVALYNEEPGDFNDIYSIGSSAMPWAINDINAFSCKHGIDIGMATSLSNWLISVYEYIGATDATRDINTISLVLTNAHPDWGARIGGAALDSIGMFNLDVFLAEYSMTSLAMSKLAEDIYTRFRYIVLQAYQSNTNMIQSELDHEAQLALFYQEQRKLQALAKLNK